MRNQCFLQPILAAGGKLILMNSILPVTIEHGIAILLTLVILALPRAQAFQGLSVPFNVLTGSIVFQVA